MRSLLSAFISIAFLLPCNVSAADDTWRFFKLNETTEESVIAVFGAPDIVNIQSSYESLKKARESDGKIGFSAYELSYNRLRGDLNILKGPLGEATSTEVQVEDGKVVAVDWDYAVKYKAAAEKLWKKDKGFDTTVGKAITIGSKKLPGDNVLFVTCTTGRNGNCDGPIKVMYGKNTGSGRGVGSRK